MLDFLKQYRKTPVDIIIKILMIRPTVPEDIEQNILKLVILGHFLLFTP